MAASRAASAMSERSILRNHVLYQKSYVEDLPKTPRTLSPNKTTYSPHKSPSKKKKAKPKKASIKDDENKKLSESLDNVVTEVGRSHSPDVRHSLSPEVHRSLSPAQIRTRFSLDTMETRRMQRIERVRPWTEKVPRPVKPLPNTKIFYDRALLPSGYKSKHTLRARKYVANSRYGNIYEIRKVVGKSDNKKAPPPPSPSRAWLWEDEFMLWSGDRQHYNSGYGNSKKKRSLYNLSIDDVPKSGTLPSIKERPRPNADLYALYNADRMYKSVRRKAAVLVQKVFRGWAVRTFIKKLKRKAVLEHSRPWPRFIQDYKDLVGRVRSRYGKKTKTCSMNLKQLESFMNKKLVYEKVFRTNASGGNLHKYDLMAFFNRCDLWPTQAEINRSFDSIFKGSRNAAEVIFVLDCSAATGTVVFHNVLKFVKDLVHVMDIASDRTRVGMIPYNEAVFNAFGLSAYNNKRELLEALSRIKLWHGLTKTDVALRLLREMYKDSRPGVKKIAIVITDGNSTDHEHTKKESQRCHDMGIEMFAIGIGKTTNTRELDNIASMSENMFSSLDVKSMGIIRRQIEKKFCLEACGFCQRLLPRLNNIGLLHHETMDLLWTLYPPWAAGLDNTKVLQRNRLGAYTPIRASSEHHVCRPISQSEALEVLWTTYPPDACDLKRTSRWIRPIVDGVEAWSMLDDDIIRATGMRKCLKLVIQSKLQRNGVIAVPSDIKEDVEYTNSETQVLDIIDKYIENRKAQEMKGRVAFNMKENRNRLVYD